MMYLLFVDKNIMPSQYYFLPTGEKLIVRAFYKEYRRVQAEEADKLKKEMEAARR